MKIVVLDGQTLNPGDLSWDDLAGLGELKVYERTPPELVKERCIGAEVVITNKALVTRETRRNFPPSDTPGSLQPVTTWSTSPFAWKRESP